MARIEVTEEPDTGKKGPDPAAAPPGRPGRRAAGRPGRRAAALRAELDDVLGELADEARECDPDDGWYPDTADLEDLLDEVEDLAAGTPGVARELAGHVMERISVVLAAGNCLSDDLADALARAEDLHRAPLPLPTPFRRQ